MKKGLVLNVCFWYELMNVLYGRRRILLLGSIILSTLALILIVQKWNLPPSHIIWHAYFNYSLVDEEPYESAQTCYIRRVHPFDKSIWKYLTPVGPLQCKIRQPELTYIDHEGYLRFNVSELKRMGYEKDTLECNFQPILQHDGEDDGFYFGAEERLQPEGSPIAYDFISVKCYRESVVRIRVVVYEYLHAHLRNITRTNLRSEPAFNVLVFGVDSLSRLAFIRLLPKTYKYLTKTMKAFVFRGMNKIGDNTFPNLCAVLTGYELYGGVLPHPPKIKHYDNWPLIWRNYSDAGHATLLAEDLPEFSMFNYLTTGFYKQPTDHYMRPYWLAVQKSSLLRTSAHLCLGSQPRHKLQMKYVVDFMLKYPKFFAFSWLAEPTHDYLQRSAVLDDDFESMLRFFEEGKVLNNTVLIFMSDHGHRFSSIRETAVGRLEERLPFVSIVVPDILKKMQPHIISALQQNTGRLVSPFDMHATLRDILRFNQEGVNLGDLHFRHGLSLFGKIPSNRTCDDVGVPENYCACGKEVELNLTDISVKKAADVLVNHLNDLLKVNQSTNPCAFLQLNFLKSAHLTILNQQTFSNESTSGTSKSRQLITVVVETKPGFGIFEATAVLAEDRIYVTGDVSRLNMYRGQSDCIEDRTLRKYCYCT